MAAISTTRQRPARGRRAARPSGDDRERAILATAERLLETRSFREISIDDLARGAGISRPTFYFYFPSKDAVLLTLLDRMVEEAAAMRERIADQLPDDAAGRLRESLAAFYEIFGAHRAVALAAAEAGATNAEARALWAQIVEGWVSEVSAEIEAERARGAAPAGLPARDLAIALIQMNEKVFHEVFAKDGPALAEDNVVDVLAAIWLSAIYGTTAPG
jgi:AcrR family transcriptional regulator